jgi:hypothetical protein
MLIGTYYFFLECGKNIRVKLDSYFIESCLSVTKKCAVNSVRKIIYIYCDTHTKHVYTLWKKNADFSEAKQVIV